MNNVSYTQNDTFCSGALTEVLLDNFERSLAKFYLRCRCKTCYCLYKYKHIIRAVKLVA